MANLINNNWNLVTSHGLVLFHLSQHPDCTIRKTAESLELTERRVIEIIHDLVRSGLIESQRLGRRNTYKVNKQACFRHATLASVPVSTVTNALDESKESLDWRGGDFAFRREPVVV